jgi:hypothetical protein
MIWGSVAKFDGWFLFRPIVEWQVAYDQRGSALVALGDQFKQQLSPGFAQWIWDDITRELKAA